MPTYNGKIFNGNVFEKYTKTIESTKEISMLKSSLLKRVNKYSAKLKDEAGGNYITEPFKGRIGGSSQNYDGVTDFTSTSRKSFSQGKIAISRGNVWGEEDWADEITGTNWTAEATEINQYWDEELQTIIISVLKGIFASTANNFNTKHTYNVNGNLGADSFNKASQAVLGDKKRKLQIAFMHSAPATNLESLQLLDYLKYTDANGITRDLTIGQVNGKVVFIDDQMPTNTVATTYKASTDTEVEAGKTYYTRSGSTGNYTYTPVASPTGNPSTSSYYEVNVEGYTEYTTYLMENGYFEYEDLGVKTPYEVSRDAKTNGGRTELVSRRRFILVPDGISFTKNDMDTDSPTNEELENGSNWEPINDGGSPTKEYIDDKLIPLVQIISRG